MTSLGDEEGLAASVTGRPQGPACRTANCAATRRKRAVKAVVRPSDRRRPPPTRHRSISSRRRAMPLTIASPMPSSPTSRSVWRRRRDRQDRARHARVSGTITRWPGSSPGPRPPVADAFQRREQAQCDARVFGPPAASMRRSWARVPGRRDELLVVRECRAPYSRRVASPVPQRASRVRTSLLGMSSTRVSSRSRCPVSCSRSPGGRCGNASADSSCRCMSDSTANRTWSRPG